MEILGRGIYAKYSLPSLHSALGHSEVSFSVVAEFQQNFLAERGNRDILEDRGKG